MYQHTSMIDARAQLPIDLYKVTCFCFVLVAVTCQNLAFVLVRGSKHQFRSTLPHVRPADVQNATGKGSLRTVSLAPLCLFPYLAGRTRKQTSIKKYEKGSWRGKVTTMHNFDVHGSDLRWRRRGDEDIGYKCVCE